MGFYLNKTFYYAKQQLIISCKMSSKHKKLCKSASGLRILPTSDEFSSPFRLNEPDWIPDFNVLSCSGCQKVFDFLNRKHHCRRCGSCFCGKCTNYKLNLTRMNFIDPVRHCYECAIVTKNECQFFDNNVKYLLKGCEFNLYDSDENYLGQFTFYLSGDYRHLKNTVGSKQENNLVSPIILMKSIVDVNFLKDDENNYKGFVIKFKDENDSGVMYKMVCTKYNKLWFSAFFKALKMIFESQKDSIVR